MEKEDGVWRTIRGRRIFIASGQSLGEAMSKSGKFKREDIRTAKRDLSLEQTMSNRKKQSQGQIDKSSTKWLRKEKARYHESKNQAEKNRINENAPIDKDAKTRVDRNIDRYSEADRREIRREDLQRQRQDIQNYKAKKQSNNKVDPYDDTESNESQRLQSIQSRYDEYLQDTEGRGASYGEIAYVDSLRGKDLDDFEKELDDYETKKFNTEKLKNELSIDNNFSQTIGMTGDVKLYSQNDLKRMEEAGVRPKKESYTGGGWEGTNYDSHLTTKEIGKRVNDAMKKQFPDVKIARRGDNYSMGSSIDFNIMSSDKDLYVSDKEIDKMTDFGRLSVGNGFTDWAEKNVDGFKKYTHEQYTDNDVRKYAKEVIANLRKHDNQNVRGDEWYLSDYGKKVVSELNKQADSYTYNDSDGMVDYFDHGTYMHISIGKWDKPYQVNESKKIKDYVSKKKSNH